MITIHRKQLSLLPASKEASLFSIGSGNGTPEDFLERLKKYSITTLVDVRTSPKSQYMPWVNKSAFSTMLIKAGINYVYGGEHLGGLNELSNHNPLFIEKMAKVVALSKQGNVAMMCSEGQPIKCHRAYKLSRYLMTTQSIDVMHILPDASLLEQSVLQAHPKTKWPTP